MSELDLTVITATTPERSALFGEALKSLHAQTLKPSYRFMRDDQHRGPAQTLNQLAAGVDTEWLFRLDDDDLLDPDHFEVLSHWLDQGDADIVYTYCRVDGVDDPNRFQVRWQSVGNGWGELYERNWIPCSAAIRTELFHDLGGYDDVPEEDWDLWKRALDVDATFVCVPCATWTYRMNPEWKHRSDREFVLIPDPPVNSFTIGELS